MIKKFTQDELVEIEGILQMRSSRDIHIFKEIKSRILKEEEREAIRSVLLEEFLEKGLSQDDEPNKYGKKIDDYIGRLRLY